jgi:hypothetical protein
MSRDLYHTINARLSLAGEKWGVTAWGRNITDEYPAEIIPPGVRRRVHSRRGRLIRAGGDLQVLIVVPAACGKLADRPGEGRQARAAWVPPSHFDQAPDHVRRRPVGLTCVPVAAQALRETVTVTGMVGDRDFETPRARR